MTRSKIEGRCTRIFKDGWSLSFQQQTLLKDDPTVDQDLIDKMPGFGPSDLVVEATFHITTSIKKNLKKIARRERKRWRRWCRQKAKQ